MVMASDQALPLAGECLERGAETVLDKDMSFERLVAALHRLISRRVRDDRRGANRPTGERRPRGP